MQTRRELLQGLASAAAATFVLPEPRARASGDVAKIVHPSAKADAIIVLWMAGGMAAPDTFDPKKYKPFEPGLAVADVISTFPSIPTAIDGVRICNGLPEIAKVLDRATLIRSHVQPDLGSILHSRHQYHWHTGYVPPQTVACPHIGSWMSRVLGLRNPVMPAFVNIGQRLEGIGENEEIKAFTTAGFFGSEFGPMNLPFPEQAAVAVRPPKGMEPGRFASRYAHFKRLVATSPNREFMSDYHQESMLRSLENAHRLLGAKEREAVQAGGRYPSPADRDHAEALRDPGDHHQVAVDGEEHQHGHQVQETRDQRGLMRVLRVDERGERQAHLET